MRPVPAGRQRGQCCTPYSRLQEEIDNVETIAVTANNTANNAANAANTAVATANSAMAGLTDGSVTKIGTSTLGSDTKPIKLVGGVPTVVTNELMDLTTDYQMVTGEKWFLAKPTLKDVSPEIRSNNTNGIKGCDSDGITKASVMFETDGRILLEPGIAGTKAAQVINQRAYDPANTDDIATIGTLDSYTPMVRTTGNQVVGGSKTLTGETTLSFNSWARLYIQNKAVKLSQPDSPEHSFDIRFSDTDGTTVGILQFRCGSSSRSIRIGINDLNGNTTWTTLGSVTL